MSSLLNFSNVTTDWCFIFITLVSEWFCVIIILLFPFIFWYANIILLGFCCWWWYALIKNVIHSAFPLHQTILFLSTIIWKFLIFVWLKFVLILTAYYLGNIFCATITYLNWVTIEYFMQLYFLEIVSNSFKKILMMFVMTLLL